MKYREKARAVRAEAQARLTALRAARRAKRPGGPSGALETPQPAPSLEASDDAAALADQARERVEQAALAAADRMERLGPAGLAQDDTNPASAPLEAGSAAGGGLDPLAGQDAASANSPPVDPGPASSTVRAGLEALPGVGPGLIHMLQAAGVSTLDDLAGSDLAHLRARLGFVGTLVNLEGWIAYARDKAA